MICTMATEVYELGLYLHLVRASESRQQMLVRDRLLVIAASGLFGLYPAVRAASANPLQTVREQ